MEWDQIAANWAAMAQRLCSGRPIQDARPDAGLQDTDRAATGGEISGGLPTSQASTIPDLSARQ